MNHIGRDLTNDLPLLEPAFTALLGRMNDQTKGLLITAIGVILVAPDSLFIRLIDAPTLVIAFWRTGLTGVMIMAVLAVTQGRELRKSITQVGRNGVYYALCAAVSSILFIFAVQNTSVANAVFIIAAMPIFAAFYSWLLMGERISRRMVWTIALVLAGIGIIAYGSIGEGNGNIVGDMLAIGVAAIFALGLTMARRGRAVSMIPAAAGGYIGVALCILPFIDPFDVAEGDWIWVALHGGVFIAFSTALLSLGPRYITSAEVALLILLESVLAPIIVWVVIGEEPTQWALIGGAIVLGVLFISNLIALRRRRA